LTTDRHIFFQAAAVQLKLVLIKNGKRTREIPLTAEVVIGRGKECSVRVLAHDISRRHCRIRQTGGVARIKDLGSTNGTYVNGKVISGEQLLRVGDTVQIGPVVFELDVGSPASTSLIPETAQGSAPSALPRAEVVEVGNEPDDLPLLGSPVDEPETVHKGDLEPARSPKSAGGDDLPMADLVDED
jgi:pSer/pThr/pTyr-binding forkhead associated (FHA) protein